MPQTLLLADDSLTIQRVIELTFADEDIKVIAVSDGDQAIKSVEANPPDIVLADVGMPGKSGYDVAEYIKKSPRLAHIPVMLLTGAFEPVDQERARRAGCDGVLQKPFEPQVVIARIKQLLARSRQAGGYSEAPEEREETGEGLNPEPDNARGWSAVADQLSPADTPTTASPSTNLEEYFDRLDAAFASLESGSAPETPDALNAPSSSTAESLDWFDYDAPGLENADLPLASAASLPPPAPPTSPTPVFGPLAPVPESGPASSGTLADAFTHLLAAEQGQPLPLTAPSWAGTAPAAAIDTDALVERVARRVLDRLSDRVVRETVADIVSNVADRLVRDEIERIKSANK